MIRSSLALAAALALSGCTNLCDQIDSFSTSFESRHKACGVDAANAFFTKATCTKSLASCTKADQEKLNRYLDCLKQVPDCTRETLVTTWSVALRQCSATSGIVDLTPACQQAIQPARSTAPGAAGNPAASLPPTTPVPAPAPAPAP